MLSTVSHSSPRARAFHAGRISSMRILGPSSTALNKGRHRQQTRGFRFGMWSSHLDPEFHREIRRRTRAVKYKYMESLNRRLSWDQHPLAEDPKVAIKKIMAQYWNSSGRGGRYINVERVKSWSDEFSGARPGRNIEDVERSAINNLFQGNGTAAYEYDVWQTPLRNIRNYLARTVTLDSSSESRASKQSKGDTLDGDYEIDPITNRKVWSSQNSGSDSNIAVKTFKSYRSAFADSVGAKADENAEAFHSDGPPPAAELHKYSQVKIDVSPWDGADPQSLATTPHQSSESPAYADLDKYKPVMHASAHADGVEEPKYDDLSRYRPTEFTESSAADESMPKYTDLDKYGPSTHIETGASQDPAPQYEDLGKYGPVMHQEDVQPSNAGPKYKDLGKYGPVMYNESVTVGDPAPLYDDLDKYVPVKWNEPDGLKPLTAEELSKQYDDLDKYGPVRWNEPDGFAPIHPEEASKAYADLGKYGPFAHNEPDGKPLQDMAASEEYTDLGKYGPFVHNEPDGKPLQEMAASEEYTDLGKYMPFAHNEPDGKAPQEVESLARQSEMSGYKPYQYNEPDGQPPQQLEEHTNAGETKNYGAYRYNEPDGQPIGQPDGVANSLREFDLKAASLEAAQPATSWLGKVNSFFSSELEQERAEDLDLLRASDIRARINPRALSSESRSNSAKHPSREMLASEKSRHENEWDAASNEARSAVLKSKTMAKTDDLLSTARAWTGNFIKDFPEEFSRSWTALLQPKANSSSFDAEYEQRIQAKAQNAEKGEIEFASFDESFPKLEPALNRRASFNAKNTRLARMQAQMDPYSTDPQGLELSFAHECGGRATMPAFVRTYGTVATSALESADATQTASEELKVEKKQRDRNLVSEIRSIYEDVYGKIDAGHRPATVSMASAPAEVPVAQPAEQPLESAREGPAEPTVYKILAYDPTMQTINTAETTSIVADSATPLTPAEVLLRLSNPAKFFPHFSPLQAQGYEIVSGSGDVLVFRKVRDAAEIRQEPAIATATTTMEPPAPTQAAPRVNPIDMMGSRPVLPSTGNFASPTGFVNYNYPGAEAGNKPPPPFRSMIDVRREEPVFSGAKSEQRSKKQSFGKRMIVGAAWVAGISYALGVVGEYFATGGADGLGPKGF